MEAKNIGVAFCGSFCTMARALDRRALCYTVEEFLSSFQEA